MAKARLLRPDREQTEMVLLHLDSLIDPDHSARIVWAFVQECNLSELIDKIRSVDFHPGRPAIDPRLLFSLWLYAYTQGVGSARHLEELCATSADYQWMCGGVHVCHKTLSAFRSSNTEIFEKLLTRCIAALMHKKLVTLDLVTLDGVRVRANAGASSFRKEETLRQKLTEATALVEDLAKDLGASVCESAKNKRKRQARAAQERKQRIEQALEQLAQAKAGKGEVSDGGDEGGGEGSAGEPQVPRAPQGPCPEENVSASQELATPPGDKASTSKEPKKPRASTTDPEARIMKMADGGYRPAFNVQVVCEKETALIVAVEISQMGNDAALLPVMLDIVQEQYKAKPRGILVDGGYTQGYKVVMEVLSRKCEVYGPPRTVPEKPKSPSAKSRAKKKPQEVKEWEERMGLEEPKEICRQRGQVAEYCNARLRYMDGYQLSLRSRSRVKSEILLRAIAHNMQVMSRKWGIKQGGGVQIQGN